MNDNQRFSRFFDTLPAKMRAEILRDSAKYFREHGNEKQAHDLEHEAFLIDNWQQITQGGQDDLYRLHR